MKDSTLRSLVIDQITAGLINHEVIVVAMELLVEWVIMLQTKKMLKLFQHQSMKRRHFDFLNLVAKC